MKQEHEARVLEAVTQAFASVGFSELEVATHALLQSELGEVSRDFSLTALNNKIKKNALGINSRIIITSGLSLSGEIQNFIECVAQTDEHFAERLKLGFLSEYHRLRKEGHFGDVLFELMCRFAQEGFSEQASRSAALAILIYLFETCEVFEK